jgi:hypothetical protein
MRSNIALRNLGGAADHVACAKSLNLAQLSFGLHLVASEANIGA